MVYTWKSGARIRAKAEDAARVFEELERKGELTPQKVVAVSKPKDAPLHGEFEWNDRKAAEKFRESQARHLIMCLVVRDETEEVEMAPTRAFFPVTEDKTFTHISRIISDEEMREALLAKALKELESFQRKYEDLLELKPVNEAITKVLEKEDRKRQTAEVVSAQAV